MRARAGLRVMGCVVACGVGLGVGFGQTGTGTPEASLQALRALEERGRVLLVFAPDANDVGYRRQVQGLARDEAAMKDRDVVLMPVVGSGGLDGAELRRRFGAPLKEFTVILVGKDGGEKLRQHEALSPAKLEETIDAMPMRRAEVKARKAGARS